jgi:hypothetical protein
VGFEDAGVVSLVGEGIGCGEQCVGVLGLHEDEPEDEVGGFD